MSQIFRICNKTFKNLLRENRARARSFYASVELFGTPFLAGDVTPPFEAQVPTRNSLREPPLQRQNSDDLPNA